MNDEFKKAQDQLFKLSIAVDKREHFMRNAITFYRARHYEWAMFYQFMFLQLQDEVNVLGDKTLNTDAHRLWFLIGGRP